MPFARLDTPRLTIRRLEEKDVEALVAYRTDPEVARFDGWEDYSVEQGLALVKEMKSLEPGLPGEWFQFALALKSDDSLIGDCGFCVDGAEHSQAEIGYRLARRYQGLGLASEGVSRILEYAFAELGVERIVAYTDVENLRSIALLERLGFAQEARLQRHFKKGDGWRDDYRFALSRDGWAKVRPTE